MADGDGNGFALSPISFQFSPLLGRELRVLRGFIFLPVIYWTQLFHFPEIYFARLWHFPEIWVY